MLNKTPIILLVVGLVLLSLSQILARFYTAENFVTGFAFGTGIGILIVALITISKTRSAE